MRYFFLFLILFWCLPFFSQHNHSGGHDDENEGALLKYAPPHGGEIIVAGKYKLEVVANPMQLEDKLVIYVLKNNHKQIKLKNVSANVILKYKDGQSDSLPLIKYDDRFIANTVDLTKSANMIFNLIINNKNITGIYYYKSTFKQ